MIQQKDHCNISENTWCMQKNISSTRNINMTSQGF